MLKYAIIILLVFMVGCSRRIEREPNNITIVLRKEFVNKIIGKNVPLENHFDDIEEPFKEKTKIKAIDKTEDVINTLVVTVEFVGAVYKTVSDIIGRQNNYIKIICGDKEFIHGLEYGYNRFYINDEECKIVHSGNYDIEFIGYGDKEFKVRKTIKYDPSNGHIQMNFDGDGLLKIRNTSY